MPTNATDLDAYRREQRNTMTGEQLQDAVANLARMLGYVAAHFRPARTRERFDKKTGEPLSCWETAWRTACQYDAKGFPDLVLVGKRVIYVEIKRQHETLSPEQIMWRDKLLGAGAEWYCWRPRDWADGSIEEILRRRQPRRGKGDDNLQQGRGAAPRGD